MAVFVTRNELLDSTPRESVVTPGSERICLHSFHCLNCFCLGHLCSSLSNLSHPGGLPHLNLSGLSTRLRVQLVADNLQARQKSIIKYTPKLYTLRRRSLTTSCAVDLPTSAQRGICFDSPSGRKKGPPDVAPIGQSFPPASRCGKGNTYASQAQPTQDTGRSDRRVRLLPKGFAQLLPIVQWLVDLHLGYIEEAARGTLAYVTGAPSDEELLRASSGSSRGGMRRPIGRP